MRTTRPSARLPPVSRSSTPPRRIGFITLPQTSGYTTPPETGYTGRRGPMTKAPQVHTKLPSAVMNGAVSFDGLLESGELLTGTPTVSETVGVPVRSSPLSRSPSNETAPFMTALGSFVWTWGALVIGPRRPV